MRWDRNIYAPPRAYPTSVKLPQLEKKVHVCERVGEWAEAVSGRGLRAM